MYIHTYISFTLVMPDNCGKRAVHKPFVYIYIYCIYARRTTCQIDIKTFMLYSRLFPDRSSRPLFCAEFGATSSNGCFQHPTRSVPTPRNSCTSNPKVQGSSRLSGRSGRGSCNSSSTASSEVILSSLFRENILLTCPECLSL